MDFWGSKMSTVFSIKHCNGRNFQRSIWSSMTAVVEVGMVLPHCVTEPALSTERIAPQHVIDRCLPVYEPSCAWHAGHCWPHESHLFHISHAISE